MRLVGWGGAGDFFHARSVPVVAQAASDDGSKLIMTAPVNGVAVASQVGIPSLLP